MNDQHIPIIEETAVVTKRAVETGRVRISTNTQILDSVVSTSLERETIDIERRPMERQVEVAPPPHEDGNTTVISIVEERAVLTRALFVVEEIVIRRSKTTDRVEIPVSLRAMRASVERVDANATDQERIS